MLDLFCVAKCSCYDDPKQPLPCHCSDENRIPPTVLEIYIDQLKTRHWVFVCDCVNNHKIALKHSAAVDDESLSDFNLSMRSLSITSSKTVGYYFSYLIRLLTLIYSHSRWLVMQYFRYSSRQMILTTMKE